METALFDFVLPPERIALYPVQDRTSAKLLLVPAGKSAYETHHVYDLPQLLQPGDALVLNNTKVIPAQLAGKRYRENTHTESKIAVTLMKRQGASQWQVLAKPAKRLAIGDKIVFGHGQSMCMQGQLVATVAAKHETGEIDLVFELSGADLDTAISQIGEPPLPPYISSRRKSQDTDAKRYQTVYAVHDGSVAAPTAGLHFTPELLHALEQKGISLHYVTLHVGAGTFMPVKVEDTREHIMHSEWATLTKETAEALNQVHDRGGRIVAVGTTSLRVLESAALSEGRLQEFAGETSIFITPGYNFKCVDGLMTNFHLPRSTLFMLVSAFSGLERMKAAYQYAIEHDFRFYSFGDTSLLWRQNRTD